MPDRTLVSPDAALPVFCRGMRAFYGMSHLREFAQISAVSTAALSRMERGLIMPSSDILLRWSGGRVDGEIIPDLWVTAIAAAAATFPNEAQFMWARFTDPVHRPDTCWTLAVHAAQMSQCVPTTATSPAVHEALVAYTHAGRARYPRFGSALPRDTAADAGPAAWFAAFRYTPSSVWNDAIRFLLDESAPGALEEERMTWLWLVRYVWALHNPSPTCGPVEAEQSSQHTPLDPLWRERETLWPRLSCPAKEALVTLARQSSPN
jgi:transcriptional regulator with XRE-family HTH domain